MKASCNRHVAEQRTSQTRTTRASAFYPFTLYPFTQRRPKWRYRMHSRHINRLLATFAAGVCIAATLGVAAADDNFNKGSRKTESPIEHVVIIVGENRSFDHIFATYVPTHRHHKVLNLLSQGIVKADGSPGANFAKGHQFQLVSPPNLGKFFISAKAANKSLYATLPPPDIGGVPATSPLAFILGIPGGDPGLPP